ncbi:MAG: hypothetical protein V5A48_14905, partial [Salinivenus sp.]
LASLRAQPGDYFLASLRAQPGDYFLASLRALKFLKLSRRLSGSNMRNFGRSVPGMFRAVVSSRPIFEAGTAPVSIH